MKNIIILLFFVLFFLNTVYPQDIRLKGTKKNKNIENQSTPKENITTVNYEIYGKILDSQTSEPLPGVKIFLKEKPDVGTLSDLEGNFYLKNLEPQNWTLVTQYVGYQSKEIAELNPKELNTSLVITLQETGVQMQEVVIQSNVRKESEISAILLQKSNLNISDVFSGDMILKSSSDLFVNTALTRMPGISIVEDKYLVCRGMPERYNTILLNGSLMPVLHADKQTFDFNNLPSNIISNIQLIKSYSSDIPGGFGAGVIGFETSDMPEQNKTVFNYQLGFNPSISFHQDYFPKMNNKSGKIGIFNTVKSFMPENFPDAYTLQNLPTHSDEKAYYAKQLHSDFKAVKQSVRPNQSFAIQIQRKYDLNNTQKIGFTIASNFSEISAKENTTFKFFENYDKDLGYNPVSDSGDLFINKNVQTFNQILNFNYSSPKFQIHWKNYFSKIQWANFSESIADHHYIDVDNNIDTWYDYRYWYNRIEKQNLLSSQILSEYLLHQNEKTQSKIALKFYYNQSQYQIPLNYPFYSELGYDSINYYLTSEYLENFYDLIFICNSPQNQKDRMIGSNIEWKYQRKWNIDNYFHLSIGNFVLTQNRIFESRNIGLMLQNQTPFY